MKGPAESKSQVKLENNLDFDHISLLHTDLLAENESFIGSRYEYNISLIIGTSGFHSQLSPACSSVPQGESLTSLNFACLL